MQDNGPTLETMAGWSADLFEKYGKGIEEGRFRPEKYTEDLTYSCGSFVNHNVGGLACPNRDRVKRGLTSIVKDLLVKHDKEGSSALSYFLQALTPGYGLDIPYQSKNPTLKRLTVKESIEMVYKLTDPKYPINNLEIEFREDDEYDSGYDVDNWSGLKRKGKTKELAELDELEDHVKPEEEIQFKKKKVKVKVNTLDRVEITVRDVRFNMNYLGAHYKNAVAKAEDYNETVSKKLKMFNRCVGLRFCGKFLNKQQLRMGKNAVSAYPGLHDANSYEEFGFGPYMQVLLSTFVRSSSKKSQKSALVKVKVFGKRIEVPLVQTKRQLKKHNGKILTKISMLSGFSNLARFVRDRVGRTPDELKKNLESKKLQVLNDLLLYGMNPLTAEKDAESLLSSLVVEDSDGNSLLGQTIDWISDLNYQDQRDFEEFAMNAAVVASFLGIGPTKLNYGLSDELYERYRDNNLQPIISILSVVSPHLSSFQNHWPNELEMMDLVRLLAKPLRFIVDQVLEGRDLVSNMAYRLINEGYLLARKMLNESTEFSKAGSFYLANFLSNEEMKDSIMSSFKSLKSYISFLEVKNEVGQTGYSVLGENLNIVLKDQRFSLGKLKTYFLMTTKTKSCLSEQELDCKPNVHYDEPARLLIFASKKQGSKKTNIERLFDTLFNEYINDYSEMIDHLFPLIRIKLNN